MLFPEARAAVEQAAAETPVQSPGFDIAAARAQAREQAAAQPREDVAEDTEVDADGVRCRLYLPATVVPGVIVHLHGGGFVLNDIDVHDAAVRRLANRSRRRVLSVDYRLAPEDPFPAARDDVDTVLAWTAREGAALGLEGPLFAHGDSAGGNLALVAALRHPGLFRAVAMVYPFLDPTRRHESHRTEKDGFDTDEAAWYWRHYSGGDDDLLTDPDLAPLLSDKLGTLPPLLVITAEHDPVRTEGEHLARVVAHQGVAVVSTRYQGQVHGFWRHPGVFPVAEQVMRQTASFLDSHA